MSNLKGSQTAAEAPSSGASATKDGKKKNDENLSQNWIFVGNLTIASEAKELKDLFCHFGKVLEFFINSNLGFASVKMDTRENAEEAIRKLDGMELHGEKILLRFASEEKSLKVDTYSTAIKVGNLSPVVTNERLKQAFQQFGQVERAVVIADNEGNSTTRGIVEFKRVLSAQNAVKQIEEGCFLITSSPRPISATLIEQEDSNCGVPEEKITKTSQYIAETMKAPRFAVAGSFEQQIAQTWKIRYQLERQQRDQVEENIARSRKIFEEQLITCFTKQQAAMKIKQEALSHSDEEEMFVQERKRIRMEASQRNNDETPSNIVRTPQQNAVKKEVEEPTTKEIVPFCPVKVTTRPTAPSLLADNWKDGADEEEHLEIEEMITNETDEAARRQLIKDKFFPYKCPQCPKRYKTPSSYRDHILDHKEERPHKCPHCKKAFRHEKKYKQHFDACSKREERRKVIQGSTPQVTSKTKQVCNELALVSGKKVRKREDPVSQMLMITTSLNESSDDSDCGEFEETSCRKCAKKSKNGLEAMKNYFCGADGEENSKRFLQQHSLIPRYRRCGKCQQICRYEMKRKRYKCDKSDDKGVRCNYTVSECKGTFFAHLQMTYKEFMTFLFRYFSANLGLNTENEIQRTSGTFTKWTLRFNEVSRNFVENQSKIGGPDTVVQLDEIFVCSRKDGDLNRAFWVLGGAEQGTERKFFYYFEGQPSSSDKLISIIQKFVHTGGSVMTNKFAVYNQLGELGYNHVVSNLGTPSADQLWGDVRFHVNNRGHTANYMSLYICRYILIKSFETDRSRLHQFLQSAASMYPTS